MRYQKFQFCYKYNLCVIVISSHGPNDLNIVPFGKISKYGLEQSQISVGKNELVTRAKIWANTPHYSRLNVLVRRIKII